MNKNENIFIILAHWFLRLPPGMSDWLEEPKLLRCWYWLCGLFFGQVVANYLFRIPLKALASSSGPWALIYRLTFLCAFLALIILLFVFTARYAEYAMSRKRHLQISHVVFFYVLAVMCFGKFYYFLYFLSPALFSYTSPSAQVTPLLTDLTVQNYQMTIEFLLFAALQSVSSGLHKIQSASLIVSAFQFVQSIYTLVIVSILIAGYVNQRFYEIPPKQE